VFCSASGVGGCKFAGGLTVFLYEVALDLPDLVFQAEVALPEFVDLFGLGFFILDTVFLLVIEESVLTDQVSLHLFFPAQLEFESIQSVVHVLFAFEGTFLLVFEFQLESSVLTRFLEQVFF